MKQSIDEIVGRILFHVSDVSEARLEPAPECQRADWASLGLDSVSVFQLQMKLESEFDVVLEDTFMLKNKNPTEAASTIASLSQLGGEE